jgi:hypothetical protein
MFCFVCRRVVEELKVHIQDYKFLFTLFWLMLLYWSIVVSHICKFLVCCILLGTLLNLCSLWLKFEKTGVHIFANYCNYFQLVFCVVTKILLSWIPASRLLCSRLCLVVTNNIFWCLRLVRYSLHRRVVLYYLIHSYSSGSNVAAKKYRLAWQHGLAILPSIGVLVFVN